MPTSLSCVRRAHPVRRAGRKEGRVLRQGPGLSDVHSYGNRGKQYGPIYQFGPCAEIRSRLSTQSFSLTAKEEETCKLSKPYDEMGGCKA